MGRTLESRRAVFSATKLWFIMTRNVLANRRSRPALPPGGLTAMLAAVLATAACGATPAPGTPSTSTAPPVTSAAGPGQPPVIRIATDLPATSQFGPSEQDGVQLAIDDATEQGLLPDYQLSLVSEAGPQGVRAAIADPSVLGVVGPVTSAQSAADLPSGESAPLAFVSPSAGDQPAGVVPVFRLAVSASVQGAALADFPAKTKLLRTAYVVDDTQPEGQALAAAFTDEWRLLGGQVTGQVSVPAGTTSYVNVLTQASVTRPDLIFYGGDAATGAISLRQQMLQVPGLKNTVFVGGDGAHTAAFAQAIGSTSTTYSATAGPDGSDDPGFRTRFVTRFGAGSISTYSAAAYDATMILLHAIITARSGGTLTRPAVLAAVAATNYQGTGATWSFDVTGGPATRIVTIYTPAPANLSQGDGWQYVTSICPTC